MALYTQSGRRRILPPLVFGAGVLLFLLRHGRRFDAVHTASFPYFSLLAAGVARRRGGYRLVVDWHEVWTREYWREYLGEPIGARSAGGSSCSARAIPQRAFCFSLAGVGLRVPRRQPPGRRPRPPPAGQDRGPPRRPQADRHRPRNRLPLAGSGLTSARWRSLRSLPPCGGLPAVAPPRVAHDSWGPKRRRRGPGGARHAGRRRWIPCEPVLGRSLPSVGVQRRRPASAEDPTPQVLAEALGLRVEGGAGGDAVAEVADDARS